MPRVRGRSRLTPNAKRTPTRADEYDLLALIEAAVDERPTRDADVIAIDRNRLRQEREIMR